MKRYNFIKAILGWIFRIVFRIKYVNRENQPPMGTPYIVCSNHAHFFDVVPIGLALKPQIHFMAKKEVFKTPFLRGVAKLMGAYPVNRGGNDIGAIKKTIEILKNGGCVGVFPQGTRCSYIDPALTEPKEGIGVIAARAGVGILPVCVRTKRNKMGVFRKTEIVIGEYLPPEKLEFPELTGMEKHKAITNLAFSQVCKMNNEIEREPLPPERTAQILEEINRKTHNQK